MITQVLPPLVVPPSMFAISNRIQTNKKTPNFTYISEVVVVFILASFLPWFRFFKYDQVVYNYYGAATETDLEPKNVYVIKVFSFSLQYLDIAKFTGK